MKRILTNVVALAALALFAMTAAAQQGRWRLVHAEYGASNSWSDVTSTVRSLIQNHQLDIRVDNATLGGDPAPGVRKSLRLRLENERGESKVFNFSEKAVVQLSVFARFDDDSRDREQFSRDSDGGRDHHDDDRDGDADRARWFASHHGLRILRADYGVEGRFADVTQRLAPQIQDNRLALRVDNYSMGGDPADHQRKTLTVWYVFDGRSGMETVNEGDSISLPSDSDFFQDRLRVMRAQYGADFRYFDVTDRLNSLIQNDQLDIRIDNSSMGGDPAPDRRKRLTVVYLFDGQPYRAVVDEHGALSLPNGGASIAENDAARLEILHATYGAEGRRADVTNIVRAAANGNQLQFAVSNGALGGDPAPGLHKNLRVIYRWGGVRYEAVAAEHSTLAIP